MWRVMLVTLALPLLAHHSTAEFDMTSSVTVTGVVTKFDWANPHSFVELDAGRDHWIIEMEAVNFLRHQGWTKTTLKVGDRISCTGARAKDPAEHTLKSFSVELSDGQKLKS
jgi:hypothetical protein